MVCTNYFLLVLKLGPGETVCCYDVVNSSFWSDVSIGKQYLSDLVNATYIFDVALRRMCDFNLLLYFCLFVDVYRVYYFMVAWQRYIYGKFVRSTNLNTQMGKNLTIWEQNIKMNGRTRQSKIQWYTRINEWQTHTHAYTHRKTDAHLQH